MEFREWEDFYIHVMLVAILVLFLMAKISDNVLLKRFWYEEYASLIFLEGT